MNPNDPNVILLELVARRLGNALRQDLVFVGGAVAGLLVTDPAMPAIRPTEDVDLIVHAVALADYHKIERALVIQGFVQDLHPEAPICRWKVDAVTVDVMPTLEAFAGRGNNDYLFSHDLGDLLAVIDGRDTLIEECRAGAPELKAYLRDWIARLLATPAFLEALPGHLPGDAASQTRAFDLEEKLRQLANLD